MQWDAVDAVGSFLGAAGVIATLVYLSRQIRDQNRALRTTIRDSAFQQLQQWNYSLISEPTLSAVFQRGLATADWRGLREEDRARLVHTMYSFFKMFENIFLHSLDESIGPSLWERNKAILIVYASQPGARYYLQRRRATFDPRFLEFIDTMGVAPMLSGVQVAQLSEERLQQGSNFDEELPRAGVSRRRASERCSDVGKRFTSACLTRVWPLKRLRH